MRQRGRGGGTSASTRPRSSGIQNEVPILGMTLPRDNGFLKESTRNSREVHLQARSSLCRIIDQTLYKKFFKRESLRDHVTCPTERIDSSESDLSGAPRSAALPDSRCIRFFLEFNPNRNLGQQRTAHRPAEP